MGAVSDNPRRHGLLGATGGWLLLSGAALGALTVFAALIPGELGVWPRFETGGMAMLLSAGICAAALAIIWLDDRTVVEGALRHPLVLAVMLVALVSGVYAPFVDYPWLSIFGYPLIGEGVLRYASMAVFFAAAIVLRGDALRFPVLLVCLLVGSIGATAALFVWARAEFVSLDIAGILVVSAWVGAWFLMPARWGARRFVVCAGAVAPILLISVNDTAVLTTVLVGMPASALIYLNLNRHFVSVRTMRIIAAVALVAMPFAALLAIWLIPMLTDALPSITSRKFTYQVVFAALRADPSVVLAGQGWGKIVMTLDLFRTFSDATMWDGSWDGATRDLPHSHNLLLEALFGGGVVAVAGLLALIAIPVLVCKARDLPVALFAMSLFVGLGTTWPQVAMTVGPVALALGLVSAGRVGAVSPPAVGRGFAYILPVLAACLVGSGVWLVSEGLNYRSSVADVRAKGGESVHACNLLPNSRAYGNLDLVQGFVKSYRLAFQGAQAGRPIPDSQHHVIAAFLCSAEARAKQSVSASLHLGLESFRGHVSSDAGRTADIVRYRDALSGWSDKLVQLLNAAPTRTDMTLVFFTARSQSGAWETVGSLARALIHASPDDPVANWFWGRYLLNQGNPASRAAGFAALEKSLDNGIKRIFQVPADFEAKILVSGGDGSAESSQRR